MAEKIKECPFCGGNADTVRYWNEKGDVVRWAVVCHGCFGCMNNCQTEEEAIAFWNRRKEN